MSQKLKVTSIALTTADGKRVELTISEARDLHDQLAEMFGGSITANTSRQGMTRSISPRKRSRLVTRFLPANSAWEKLICFIGESLRQPSIDYTKCIAGAGD